MNWDVRFSDKAEKDLAAIHEPDHTRIIGRISGLECQPRLIGDGKLKDSRSYRLRVGDWRVIYEIDDAQRVVWIARILRRSEKTYRGF